MEGTLGLWNKRFLHAGGIFATHATLHKIVKDLSSFPEYLAAAFKNKTVEYRNEHTYNIRISWNISNCFVDVSEACNVRIK